MSTPLMMRSYGDAYYNSDKPLVSDAEYDALALAAAGDVPVGAPPPRGAAVCRHSVAMLSLQSVRNAAQLDEVMTSMERLLEGVDAGFTTELKYDGMAVAARYENGRLAVVLTRGDGQLGEVVSDAVLGHVRGLPATIAEDAPAALEVRGELVLSFAEFARLESAAANPRNAVAGMVRSGDLRGAHLDFVSFATAAPLAGASTLGAVRAQLNRWGFQTCSFARDWSGRADAVREAERWSSGATRQSTWPADGLVVKVSDVARAQALGVTRHHPRAMVAFKWGSGTQAETTVRAVYWAMDGRGFARPVAQFDAVCVDGAQLARATLHNWDYVQRHGIAPGSRVAVERAGGVIPRLIPMGAPQAVAPPPHCPCALRAPLQTTGLHLQCVPGAGVACPQRTAYRASQMAAQLGIAGIGPAVATKLTAQGLLPGPWSLLELTRDKLLEHGWTDATSERLSKAVATGLQRATFVDALVLSSVPGMGPAAWEQVTRSWPSLGQLRAATVEQLSALPNVGPTLASAVVAHLAADGAQLARDLERVGLPTSLASSSSSQVAAAPVVPLRLQDQRVCITGRLSMPRAQVAAAWRAEGASVTAQLSRKTHMLVCGDEPSPSDVAKAKKLGVSVVTESDVWARLHRD